MKAKLKCRHCQFAAINEHGLLVHDRRMHKTVPNENGLATNHPVVNRIKEEIVDLEELDSTEPVLKYCPCCGVDLHKVIEVLQTV